MSALVEADRTRLAQMLGLLGSDHAGERDAAGLAAHRMIQQHGLTWFDVLTPSLPPPDRDPADDPLHGDWRAMAAACARFPHLLNRWETDFLVRLPRFPRLSTKQRSALLKIIVRLRACGCEL